eukprot:TRINITY_DN5483_c0_g1_i3.p1 TRINITY_DN5483_c0_g1~~TRINITY_DN5483_c0_g1_i3.p1  ORF type:complete len:1451 (+),score=359.94 TRINITY_DN5483_c0_g1_i3:282-4634(+)
MASPPTTATTKALQQSPSPPPPASPRPVIPPLNFNSNSNNSPPSTTSTSPPTASPRKTSPRNRSPRILHPNASSNANSSPNNSTNSSPNTIRSRKVNRSSTHSRSKSLPGPWTESPVAAPPPAAPNPPLRAATAESSKLPSAGAYSLRKKPKKRKTILSSSGSDCDAVAVPPSTPAMSPRDGGNLAFLSANGKPSLPDFNINLQRTQFGMDSGERKALRMNHPASPTTIPDVLVAHYELVLCFGDLYAVDLFSAGKYYIKGTIAFAEKATNWSLELKERIKLDDPELPEVQDEEPKKEGAIDGPTSFTTTVTRIQFKNQRTFLDDMFTVHIVYKTEDTQSPLPPVPAINLDLQLLCHPRSASNPNCLAKKTLVITGVQTGLQIFYPLLLESAQFASVDLGIDSHLLSAVINSANSSPETPTSNRSSVRLSMRMTPISEKLLMSAMHESSTRLDSKFVSFTGARPRSLSCEKRESTPNLTSENSRPLLTRQDCAPLIEYLRKGLVSSWENYKTQLVQMWKKSIFEIRLETFQKIRTTWIKRMLSEPQGMLSRQKLIDYHAVSKSMRKAQINFDELHLRDLGADPSSDEAPVCIEVPFTFLNVGRAMLRSKLDETSSHLIVFVHGLAAGRFELRLFKNYLRTVLDYVQQYEYLLCTSIEGLTVTESIASLGNRIATEVANEIEEFKKRGKRIAKISFVGHSMGGVIIRAALKEEPLRPYLRSMHTYISLSSPHLGTVGSTKLMSSASWVFQKLANSQSLSELRMCDGDSIEDCFLWKLSVNDPLGYFVNVLLVSSEQDDVIPSTSSRIENIRGNLSDQNLNDYQRMCQNILTSIESHSGNLIRYEIHFGKSKESNKMEKWLGKAAHARFLDDRLFLQMFCSCIYKYFICEDLAQSTRANLLLVEFSDAATDPFTQPTGVIQFLEELQDEEFCSKFNLKNERLLSEVPCSIKRGKLAFLGWMYLSDNFICYKAKLFGYKLKNSIPLKDVVSVYWTRNSIEITAKDKAYIFYITSNTEKISSTIQHLIAEHQRKKIESAARMGSPELSSLTVEPLQGTTMQDWELLLNHSETKHYQKGEVILHYGTTVQAVYQVVYGKARVEGPTGSCLGYFTPDDGIFGEMSWIGKHPVSASVIADSDNIELSILDGAVLQKLFAADEALKARFYCYIAKTIAARLARTTKLLAKALLSKKKEKNKANKKQKELIEYRIMLGLSAAEPILKDRKCCFKKGFVKHVGRVFLLQNSIAFCSSVFGCETKIFFPLADESLVATAVGKHSIELKNKEEMAILSSLKKREELLELITRQQIVCRTAIVSSGNKPRLLRTVSYLQLGSWWDCLLEGARVVTYKMDEVIINIGNRGQYLFQIARGSVRVETGNVLLDILKKMEVFGDISFLKKGKTSASVIANSKKVRLYVLDSEFVAKKLAQNPTLAWQFYEYLAKRLAGRLRVVNQMW